MSNLKNQEIQAIESSLNEINSLKQREDAIVGLVASSQLADVDVKSNPLITKVLGGLDAIIAKVNLMDRLEKVEASMKAFVQLQNLPSRQQQVIANGMSILAFSSGVDPQQLASNLDEPIDSNLGPAQPVW